MKESSPIKAVEGIELIPSSSAGIFTVQVIDRNKGLANLSWDKYVRLQAAAEQIEDAQKILDVGGYDGALALFLNDIHIDLLDPETTGGHATAISANDLTYDCVVAVDVLEHIPPNERLLVLYECARVSIDQLILNYPCQSSADAQALMLKLTNNPFVKEHVQWPLPDTELVIESLNELGFDAEVTAHSNIAVWLGQYLVQNLLPDMAPELNKILIEQHSNEPFDKPLYHLITAKRKRLDY